MPADVATWRADPSDSGGRCHFKEDRHRLDAIRERAGAMHAKIMKEPWQNPLAGWREFTLMDPDGYRIAVAQF
jgi:hypothetical protein